MKFVSSRCTSWAQIKRSRTKQADDTFHVALFTFAYMTSSISRFYLEIAIKYASKMHFQSSIISHHLINKYWSQLVQVYRAVVSVYSVYSGVEKFILLHFNEDAVFETVVSTSITDQLDTLRFLPRTITNIYFITTLITSFH